MSIAMGSFIEVPVALIRDKDIPDNAKLVYAEMMCWKRDKIKGRKPTPEELEILKKGGYINDKLMAISPMEGTAAAIIEYLNKQLGLKRGYSVKPAEPKIKALIKAGYTEEDIKQVIGFKIKEWKGTESEKYLRPETLFSKKFDGYLVAANKEKEKSTPTETKQYAQPRITAFVANDRVK